MWNSLNFCLSGLSAVIPKKFLSSCLSALSGCAEGNLCIRVLNCISLSLLLAFIWTFLFLVTFNSKWWNSRSSPFQTQVLAALWFIQGIGGHDNISAWKFLDAAKQTEDNMLFYTTFWCFEQWSQPLQGNPYFTPVKNMAAVKRPGATTESDSSKRMLAAGWQEACW